MIKLGDFFKRRRWVIAISAMLVIAATAIFFLATGAAKPNPEDNTDTGYIVHYADLNHDGQNEKIKLDLTRSEEQTILTVSDANGNVIWTEHADRPHAGWNGFYLYEDSGKEYLLNWRPTMYSGVGDYFFEVFSFDQASNKIELTRDELNFRINDEASDSLEKVSKFVDHVNTYLAKSIVLVDTDGGNLVYSTPDNPITKTYTPFWLDSTYQPIEDNKDAEMFTNATHISSERFLAIEKNMTIREMMETLGVTSYVIGQGPSALYYYVDEKPLKIDFINLTDPYPFSGEQMKHFFNVYGVVSPKTVFIDDLLKIEKGMSILEIEQKLGRTLNLDNEKYSTVYTVWDGTQIISFTFNISGNACPYSGEEVYEMIQSGETSVAW